MKPLFRLLPLALLHWGAVLSATAEPVDTLDDAVQWLEQESRRMITQGRREMESGIAAFPPQVGSGYEAFWLRDYAYMLEGFAAGFSDKELRDALLLFVNAQGEDGAGVDCVKFDGEAIYRPGYGSMGANPVADGSQFTVDVAWHSHQRLQDKALLGQIIDRLVKGMEAVPRSPRTGLVHINPDAVWDRCPYGFTDTVRKKGDLLFCSLLFVQASRQLADLLEESGRTDAALQWRKEARTTAAAIRQVFWLPDLGLFRAATVQCREPDIWGSAFAAYLGVATPEQALAIAGYFQEHYHEIVQLGQIRHLPGGVYWEVAGPRDHYQNGAFWATPTGWFVDTLDLINPELADRTVINLVRDFQRRGCLEWSIGETARLPNYLASGTNPLAGIRRMLSRRAGQVQVTQTLLDDGSRREEVMQNVAAYGAGQDEGYVLLKKLPPLALLSKPSGHRGTISIDADRGFQAIDGLGAALTDSSAWVLSQLKRKHPVLYSEVMQRLFSDRGAGFSILRRPMGSSDYTATAAHYTYADEASDDLSTFSIDHDKDYILPVLRDAIAIRPDLKIIGSPWSAPAWMKTSGTLGGIRKADKARGASNRLKPDCFDLYADYFVKFVQAYAAEGVKVHALTLQNEPQFDVGHYPGMRMTVDDQIRLIRLLGPKLKAANLTTTILAHDHNWILHPDDRKVIGGDEKADPFKIVTSIYNDPGAGAHVAGSAWHCYAGNADDMRSTYTGLQDQFPGKQIWCTEASAWRPSTQKGWFGDCSWGLRHNWLGGLDAGASAAIQWNLALDPHHGPTLRDDSLAVGLVTVDSETWKGVKFEREFYAMAQVSMAARPGSVRLDSTVTNAGRNLLVLAVRRPDHSTALVVFNQGRQPHAVDIGSGKRWIDFTVPPRSLTTLVWR